MNPTPVLTHVRERLSSRLLMALAVALGSLMFASSASAGVFWSNSSTGRIGHANFEGSEVEQEFAEGSYASGVTADAQHVYWANYYSNISREQLNGEEFLKNFIGEDFTSNSTAVAVDANHVYWTTNSGFIGRSNIAGEETDAEYIPTLGPAAGVTIYGNHVYWANYEADTIGRANVDGSEVEEEFMKTALTPFGLAVDAGHLYWSTQAGLIGRANLQGEEANSAFIATGGPVAGLAVDGAHLYWAESESIGRANVDGSEVEQGFIPAVNPLYVAVTQATLRGEASVAVTAGETVTDSATLDGDRPTGTLTFRLYAPGDTSCSSAPVATDEVAVNGSGVYSPPATVASRAGEYRWSVSYPGDANNPAATASCGEAGQSVAVTPRAGESQSSGGGSPASTSTSVQTLLLVPPAAGTQKQCVSARTETIHWKMPTGIELSRVAVTLDGKTIETLGGSARGAKVSLAGLTRGTAVVRIEAVGRGRASYAAQRDYHLCVASIPTSSRPNLFLRRGI